MAELAEKRKGNEMKIRSKPDHLSISLNQQKINLRLEPQLRQLLYTSSVSGLQRYSMIGTKWINKEDELLE